MSTESTQAPTDLSTEHLESLYERMQRIRQLEDAVHRLFLAN